MPQKHILINNFPKKRISILLIIINCKSLKARSFIILEL